jgi:apolipoprotein D and lipocalin family protein
MKTICIIAFFVLGITPGITNRPVEKVDLRKFSGKWYSLYSIPTPFDKGSRETTAIYNLNNDGYYNVLTIGKKGDDEKEYTYNSKLFPVEGTGNGQFKAQFLWPFKVDYWVIALADDYSWVVVGHPDKKFLFIMSRKPYMDKKLHDELVEKCKAMGYDTDKLTSQKFKGE